MWVSTGLSVSTQFPSLQDAPDLGWDFKFVGNVTDLVTWVHIKGGNTSSYTAPHPQAVSPHWKYNWLWPLSLPALPAKALFHMPHPGPATELASGLLPKALCSHIPICASRPGWPHHRISGKKGNFAQLESDPKENLLSFLTKTNMKSGLWAAGHMAMQRRLFSASGSYLSFTNPENVAWPLKQLNTGSEMPKRMENRRSSYRRKEKAKSQSSSPAACRPPWGLWGALRVHVKHLNREMARHGAGLRRLRPHITGSKEETGERTERFASGQTQTHQGACPGKSKKALTPVCKHWFCICWEGGPFAVCPGHPDCLTPGPALLPCHLLCIVLFTRRADMGRYCEVPPETHS